MNVRNKEGFRVCLKCKTEKPLSIEFWHKDKNRLSGFMYRCKVCEKTRIVKYRPYKERQARLTPEQKENRKRAQAKYNRTEKVRVKSLFLSYKKEDNKKGYENDLTLQNLINARFSPCTYCGFPSSGLDRKDNSKGHTVENCVPACFECNIGRMDNFTHEEMLIIGKAIKEVKSNRLKERIEYIPPTDTTNCI